MNKIHLLANFVREHTTNTKDFNPDGSPSGYYLPNDSFKPSLSGSHNSIGDNYADRSAEMLHFIIGGGFQIDTNTASSLLLNMDIVIETTVENFYNSPDFPNYLAALLGVPAENIVPMNVIAENSRKRQAGTSISIDIEVGPPPSNRVADKIP